LVSSLKETIIDIQDRYLMARKRKSSVVRGCVLLILILIIAALAMGAAQPEAPDDAESPRLLGVNPANDGMVGRDATISLSFDRPMDLESLEEAAYFEPPVDFAVSGEEECLVVPVNLLAPSTTYTFRLRQGIARDLEGRPFEGAIEMVMSTRGDGMTIEIPAFSFSGVIVEGSDPQGVANVIGFGVGHYPGTGRPGRDNFVIMAHASGLVDFPFNHLFDLHEGDEIRISYGGRLYIYRWREGMVVNENELSIIEPTSYPVLKAFVCCAESGKPSPTFHPSYRYVVSASLDSTQPYFK
jgi:LPXTG-site transpeptidase (sortase) family protein